MRRSACSLTVLGVLTGTPLRAAAADGSAADATAWAVSLGAIAAAALGHWALRRAGRRLPVLLARRRGGGPAATMPLPGRLLLDVVLLAAKVALWSAVAVVATERFPLLRSARDMLERLVVMGVTAPVATLGGKGYSAVDLLALPFVLVALWAAVSALTRMVQAQVLRTSGGDAGTQQTLGVLVRYALTFLGGVVILQAWGVDVSSLTIVASVLGVGIGFGLQNIANNFVSGLLISVERPIKPGDFVHVGPFTGTVERIGARSTEIRTQDRVTILVPNARFLEHEVVNWSHGDPLVRLHVAVGVAYGSDMALVRSALLEAARSHPDVLRDPRPRVELRGFGESALDCELLAWTNQPREQHRLTSDLNFRIEASLRRHRIDIPLPQRDLRLRSPAIDGLVAAWGRRHFTPEELMAAGDDVPAAAVAPEHLDANEQDGPRSWGDMEIDALVARMRGPGGLAIVDRRYLLTTYARCFVGREAVDWLARIESLTRDEALALGRLLAERGIIHHVLDEHGFEDANFFYRFYADEEAPRRAAG